MNKTLLFIYDGECPFCNKFAQLIELKSALPGISIINARENEPIIKDLFEKGFDLDNGAILIKDNQILHGSEAINWICSTLDTPSSSLLNLIKVIFSSKDRTKKLFPILINSRRILLALKGVPRKLI